MRKFVRGRNPLIAFLILLAGGALAFDANRRDNVDSVRQGLTLTCQRVNILRAQANLTSSVSFFILAASYPHAGEKGKMLFHRQGEKLLMIPLTDCSQASSDFKHYHFPDAERIGDLRSGKLDPGVDRVLRNSSKTIALNRPNK